MPEILNYSEFLRTDDNSLPRAAQEATLLGLRNYRKGMQQAAIQQEEDNSVNQTLDDVMNEKKGAYLDFMDQLSDIQNNIEELSEPDIGTTNNSLKDDTSTLPESSEYFNPELFDVNDISELAYDSPNSPHYLLNDDSAESEEDEDTDIEIHPRHHRRKVKVQQTSPMLTRKTIHLAIKARTFF